MQTRTSSNSASRASQASQATRSSTAKNKGPTSAGTAQKSARGGGSGGRKASNQPSNTSLPSVGGFQFTEESLAAFKAYQKQVEEDKRASVAAQDEGELLQKFHYFFFDSYLIYIAIRRRNRDMLEAEENQSQNEEAPRPAKRTRTRNTLFMDDDETNIANALQASRRPHLQTTDLDEENDSQDNDEHRGDDDQSDPGDADRDEMDVGNDDESGFGGEDEFGDNGVCVSLFTQFIDLSYMILAHS